MCKEEFVEAYKKFPPSKYELFFLKNISVHSITDNKWPGIIILLVLFFPFICEIFCQTLHLPYIYKMIPSYIYIVILFLFGILWTILIIKKSKRFKKIRNYLNVSKEEYKNLIQGYYCNRYSSMEKYIKYNSKNKKNQEK